MLFYLFPCKTAKRHTRHHYISLCKCLYAVLSRPDVLSGFLVPLASCKYYLLEAGVSCWRPPAVYVARFQRHSFNKESWDSPKKSEIKNLSIEFWNPWMKRIPNCNEVSQVASASEIRWSWRAEFRINVCVSILRLDHPIHIHHPEIMILSWYVFIVLRCHCIGFRLHKKKREVRKHTGQPLFITGSCCMIMMIHESKDRKAFLRFTSNLPSNVSYSSDHMFPIISLNNASSTWGAASQSFQLIGLI